MSGGFSGDGSSGNDSPSGGDGPSGGGGPPRGGFGVRGAGQVDRGRRGRSRLRVRLPARVITRTETRPAILADISLTGARVATDAQLRPGLEVMLEWGDYDAFGEVVWVRGVYCGIGFFDMLAVPALIATRDLDDAAHLPEDRELAREAAQNWVQGHRRL